MNTAELLQYSLRNTMSILRQVTEDLTQEQADWTPPGIANPIGALYWHVTSVTDLAVHSWGVGQAPLSQREGWQEKVITSTSEEEPDQPVPMRAIRVDLPVMHEYARAVARASRNWMDSLTPEDLERVIETPLGELSLGHALESFVVWHTSSHCGEIAALKGCQGAKGYPF